MPVYIIEHYHQLNATIKQLTSDFMNELKLHVCRLRHRDVTCCESAQLLHDGNLSLLSVLYVPQDFQRGAAIIINNLLDYFPGGYDNLDEDSIFMCPGCGLPFSQQ